MINTNIAYLQANIIYITEWKHLTETKDFTLSYRATCFYTTQ